MDLWYRDRLTESLAPRLFVKKIHDTVLALRASLSIGLCGRDPQSVDASRTASGCRYMLLLPRSPRHLGERAMGETDGLGNRESLDLGRANYKS
jgi:hypothetical protein